MIALFDVNGTLTDPAGIGAPWGRPELGIRVLRGAMLSSMAATISGRFTPFFDHLRDALAVELLAEQLDPEHAAAALERAGALDPWPDAAPALDCLRDAGWTVAAITNSGAEPGRRTLERAGLADRFDAILGVDAVGAFKPHPSTYAYAARELGTPPAKVTMIAAHAWDVTGAAEAGMRTAWVSRGEGILAETAAVPGVRGTDLLDVAQQLTAR